MTCAPGINEATSSLPPISRCSATKTGVRLTHWFVASTTILPSRTGNSPTASRICVQCTASTTKSAAPASATVPADACGPNRSTTSPRDCGPRLLLKTTSWPALTTWPAMACESVPAPIIPNFMIAPVGLGRASGRYLWLLADRLMDRADRARTFTHGSCDPLHRAVTHIAGGEESWHAGLERQRLTAE